MQRKKTEARLVNRENEARRKGEGRGDANKQKQLQRKTPRRQRNVFHEVRRRGKELTVDIEGDSGGELGGGVREGGVDGVAAVVEAVVVVGGGEGDLGAEGRQMGVRG